MAFKTEKKISQWFSKILVRVIFDFGDRYIQLKDNETEDSGSLKGDRPLSTGDRYTQVNFTLNI